MGVCGCFHLHGIYWWDFKLYAKRESSIKGASLEEKEQIFNYEILKTLIDLGRAF